jgi:hypothetical protein
MVEYLTYHNNTSHSINNMHGGVLNLPQQYQPLYKQHAWWITLHTTTIPTTQSTTCTVDYLTYHNNTSHSINNMHGGLLNLPQQYQPLY